MSDATPADCNIIIILWFSIHTHTHDAGHAVSFSDCRTNSKSLFWGWKNVMGLRFPWPKWPISWSKCYYVINLLKIRSNSQNLMFWVKNFCSWVEISSESSSKQSWSWVTNPRMFWCSWVYGMPWSNVHFVRLPITIINYNFTKELFATAWITELTLHSTPKIFLIIYLRNTTQWYRVVLGVCSSRGGVRHREVLWLAGPGVGSAGAVAKVTTIWLVVSLVPDNHTTLTWVSRTGLVPL